MHGIYRNCEKPTKTWLLSYSDQSSCVPWPTQGYKEKLLRPFTHYAYIAINKLFIFRPFNFDCVSKNGFHVDKYFRVANQMPPEIMPTAEANSLSQTEIFPQKSSIKSSLNTQMERIYSLQRTNGHKILIFLSALSTKPLIVPHFGDRTKCKGMSCTNKSLKPRAVQPESVARNRKMRIIRGLAGFQQCNYQRLMRAIFNV